MELLALELGLEMVLELGFEVERVLGMEYPSSLLLEELLLMGMVFLVEGLLDMVWQQVNELDLVSGLLDMVLELVLLVELELLLENHRFYNPQHPALFQSFRRI